MMMYYRQYAPYGDVLLEYFLSLSSAVCSAPEQQGQL